MAAPVGEVVFQQGMDNDSDVWDDTALIRAYDQAVKQVKEKLVNELGEEVVGFSSMKDNRKKKKKKKRAKGNTKEKVWLVGSRCKAVYTEDEEIYEAVITSIDRDSGTCWIRYLGYGNEEEQNLDDLLPASSRPDFPSDAESVEFVKPGKSPRQGSESSAPRQGMSRQPSNYENTTSNYSGFSSFPTVPSFPGVVPPMPPMTAVPPGFPFMPPMPLQGMGGWPDLSSSLHSHLGEKKILNVPPPPPVDNEDDLDKDSEALHSMLIAWYMSGYHTGYYQGLKEGRKSSQNTGKSSTASARGDMSERKDS